MGHLTRPGDDEVGLRSVDTPVDRRFIRTGKRSAPFNPYSLPCIPRVVPMSPTGVLRAVHRWSDAGVVRDQLAIAS